jgi:acetate kinase
MATRMTAGTNRIRGRPTRTMRILVLNSGSSTVKYQLIDMDGERVLARGVVEGAGAAHREQDVEAVFAQLPPAAPDAVGHRVVHGGSAFSRPVVADDAVCAAIEALTPLAPLHNPANLAGIRAARRRLPGVPHVAVFDTAFHHGMPAVACTYAIPPDVARQHGIRRYGFHGTNCAWCLAAAADHLGRREDSLNLIVAHLGAGASVTAIRAGRSVDTSMGMTPLEGVMMQTRSGDIDPAALIHLLRAGTGVDELDELLNHRSGVKALCGEADMRAVRARSAAGDGEAVFAREMYCYRIARYVSAYAGLAWPLDALVFTAGIGENDAGVRAGVCGRLAHLGIRIDAGANDAPGDGVQSLREGSSGPDILVVPANEELEIARETQALLGR